MVLDPDLRDFIELLVAHEVAFMLVGGYAVAAHGHPRYTGDLDIWLLLDEENARRVLRTLEDFGFGSLGLRPEDFLVEDSIVQLGRSPLRIDLLTGLDGVDFRDCAARAVALDIDGLQVPLISLEDLVRNKRASGRPQDIADVDHLT